MATTYYNTTSGMNNGNEMIRTDIFPYFANQSSSLSSTSNDIDDMVTKMKFAQSSISNTSSTTSGTSFPYAYSSSLLDNDITSSNPTPLDWSSTTISNNSTGLGLYLPPSSSSLSMKREDSDSIIGRQSGFGLFSLDEIDAAPANATNNSSTSASTGVAVEGLKYEYSSTPSMSLAFDVAPAAISSPFSSSSSVFSTDYNSLSFDSYNNYNNSSMIGNMSSMIPSSTTNPNLGVTSPSMSSQKSSSTFSSFEDSSMEPDAYSVTDVDAASDISDAWSVGSGPHSPSSPAPSSVSSITSPSIAPVSVSTSSSSSSSGLPSITSYTTSLYGRPMPATIARATPLTETQLAELATRPGPYTRGRAAALAAPIGGPRELKPVPVARGPHAGVLGGGEMASVGIYTKDDRWRKIERLREKRRARIVVKSSGGQYACRKSFADRRPRVGGRFVKMDDETKRYLALTKPGAAPAPANLETPAALKAYAAQQHAAHNASSLSSSSPSTMSSLVAPVVVNAAHVASQSFHNEALFGNEMSLQPPMPSYPLANTTNTMDNNSTTIGTWYTFPSTQITVGA